MRPQKCPAYIYISLLVVIVTLRPLLDLRINHVAGAILEKSVGNTFSASSSRKISPEDMISSNPDDVKFYLYSSPEPAGITTPGAKSEEIIPWNLTLLQETEYKRSLPVKILAHGFMSNSTDAGAFIQRVKHAYLTAKTEANIIGVDWAPLSTVKDRLPLMQYYVMAANNVKTVGRRIADMVIFLIRTGMVPGAEKVHLIGHSLGAHAMGVAGDEIRKNVSELAHRITGLDPAGPYFQKVGPGRRLDSTDANFVDIIHTNQGMMGYRGSLGHADFYPNGGGPKQPDCINVTETPRALAGICAHSLAYKYFEKSIRVKNTAACKCEHLVDVSCTNFNECSNPQATIFGEYCPESSRGDYYLKISENGKDE